jgi:hypothetical protein
VISQLVDEWVLSEERTREKQHNDCETASSNVRHQASNRRHRDSC